MNQSNETFRYPSVRVAVTENCNLRCEYCPSDGDSVEMQSNALETEGFKQILKEAVEVGFTDFSFTGGEPLLTPQTAQRTFDLADFVNELRDDESGGYTKLNTNGAHLLRYQDEIVTTGFTELKVSLDTLDPATFRSLAKRGEKVFQDTVDGIMALKDEVPIRLQTVVGKYNIDQIPDMIDFCAENNIDIKLFDISRYDNALSGSAAFANDNYISLEAISTALEYRYGTAEIKYAVGGYGHPKKVFTTSSGTKIEIRDTSPSAHYSSELCQSCPNYQCQDGLCNLVIAADGHIRFCREGGVDQTIPSHDTDGALMTPQAIRLNLAKAAGIFSAAQNVEHHGALKSSRLHLPLSVL
ncbi:hypothetical protein A2707_05560 [Candidatus Saccharibacteria bacterium RIFCSPHIGHO2_01_FULL_45_15]|nr:MAG: hypothetical protein A2707_05560 [Candidatus Saccharibacteria bacterium RIFCSPHIGHO2_01_FULL_45_15]OGL28913.1 MAG: hypothetical protein A3C39_05775 [Candidatus Saccharibacteria bacterium RIFCSPHIGHO2_02_FULL_46_12]OGL31926.1 MAG: hypothetical protein A3E76_01505 [Candidatus Saccharibacteria bacterium RIFCSPHIGHO2_12_FULL_44_22]